MEYAKAEVQVEVTHAKGKKLDLTYSLYGQNFKSVVVEEQPVGTVGNIGKDSLESTFCSFTIQLDRETMTVWSLDESWLYRCV